MIKELEILKFLMVLAKYHRSPILSAAHCLAPAVVYRHTCVASFFFLPMCGFLLVPSCDCLLTYQIQHYFLTTYN